MKDGNSFSCLMTYFDGSICDKLKSFIKSKGINNLDQEGQSICDHVTVMYGIDENDPIETSKAIKLYEKDNIKLQFGDFGIFNSDDYDVLIIKVLSHDLHQLNNLIKENVKCSGNSFPDYKAHCTLAYIKKESLGLDDLKEWKKFSDVIITDELTFSNKEDKLFQIQLRDKINEDSDSKLNYLMPAIDKIVKTVMDTILKDEFNDNEERFNDFFDQHYKKDSDEYEKDVKQNIINALTVGDPTYPKGKYMNWIFRELKSNINEIWRTTNFNGENNRLAEMFKLKISSFTKASRLEDFSENKVIDNYTFNSINNIVSKYEDIISMQDTYKKYKPESTYGPWKLYVIDKVDSCLGLLKGAVWCVSKENYANDYINGEINYDSIDWDDEFREYMGRVHEDLISNNMQSEYWDDYLEYLEEKIDKELLDISDILNFLYYKNENLNDYFLKNKRDEDWGREWRNKLVLNYKEWIDEEENDAKLSFVSIFKQIPDDWKDIDGIEDAVNNEFKIIEDAYPISNWYRGFAKQYVSDNENEISDKILEFYKDTYENPYPGYLCLFVKNGKRKYLAAINIGGYNSGIFEFKDASNHMPDIDDEDVIKDFSEMIFLNPEYDLQLNYERATKEESCFCLTEKPSDIKGVSDLKNFVEQTLDEEYTHYYQKIYKKLLNDTNINKMGYGVESSDNLFKNTYNHDFYKIYQKAIISNTEILKTFIETNSDYRGDKLEKVQRWEELEDRLMETNDFENLFLYMQFIFPQTDRILQDKLKENKQLWNEYEKLFKNKNQINLWDDNVDSNETYQEGDIQKESIIKSKLNKIANIDLNKISINKIIENKEFCKVKISIIEEKLKKINEGAARRANRAETTKAEQEAKLQKRQGSTLTKDDVSGLITNKKEPQQINEPEKQVTQDNIKQVSKGLTLENFEANAMLLFQQNSQNFLDMFNQFSKLLTFNGSNWNVVSNRFLKAVEQIWKNAIQDVLLANRGKGRPQKTNEAAQVPFIGDSPLVGDLQNVTTSLITPIWDAVKGILEDIWNGIKNTILQKGKAEEAKKTLKILQEYREELKALLDNDIIGKTFQNFQEKAIKLYQEYESIMVDPKTRLHRMRHFLETEEKEVKNTMIQWIDEVDYLIDDVKGQIEGGDKKSKYKTSFRWGNEKSIKGGVANPENRQ